MSKTAIVVFSDPRSRTDEALGRLFNALFLTYDLAQRGGTVELIFQGAGTRWAGELADGGHPAHALFESVRSHVAGVCGGCADVFGAQDGVRASGLAERRELPVPGTSGVLSLGDYLARGYALVPF